MYYALGAVKFCIFTLGADVAFYCCLENIARSIGHIADCLEAKYVDNLPQLSTCIMSLSI